MHVLSCTVLCLPALVLMLVLVRQMSGELLEQPLPVPPSCTVRGGRHSQSGYVRKYLSSKSSARVEAKPSDSFFFFWKSLITVKMSHLTKDLSKLGW